MHFRSKFDQNASQFRTPSHQPFRKSFIKNQFLWSGFLISPYRACGVVGQSPTERKVAGEQHRGDFNPLAD
jgi:hypothetical protein